MRQRKAYPPRIANSKYRSSLEEKVAESLGCDFRYETDRIPYTIDHNYIPDFLLPNGIYLEVKGYLDVDDKRKMRAVKAQNPDADIRFVFQRPHTLIPGTKTTHAQWADKHGFPWCGYKEIPESWLTPSGSTTATISATQLESPEQTFPKILKD